ncbi:MAG: biopolymer transporter ExbD [Opitutales bacterium]
MRSNLTDQGDDIAVDMAPLIDCVFLLLIFFLVATTMKKFERELPIELPDAAAAVKVPQETDMLVIGIDAGGNYYLNTEDASVAQLNEALKAAGEQNPQPKVRIDADRGVDYQHILHTLDQAAFWGLNKVGFHVREEAKKR